MLIKRSFETADEKALRPPRLQCINRERADCADAITQYCQFLLDVMCARTAY